MTELFQTAGLFDLWVRFGVVLLRVGGLFVFLPILGSSLMNLRLRTAIAAVLAFALFPLIELPPLAGLGFGDWTLLAARELAVGLGMGIAARMIFAGIEAASAIVAGQSGFAIASMVDPASGDPSIIPATFHALLGTTLLLAADLHHLFVRAALASYDLMPVGPVLPEFGGLEPLGAAFGARMFGVAIELAAPALVVSVAGDLVMVLVGKAMPQVPILMVAYPLKMALGLVAMAILSISIGNALGWMGRTLAADASRLMTAMAGT